jgi:nicotinamide-nucleotide amidase
MRAEIVSIGDELLKGQRVNTNATYMAGAFAGIGIPVTRITACSDIEAEIIEVLTASLDRNEVVLVTGGLGPTRDDRTRNAVQQLLKRGLEVSEEACLNLANLMKQRGRTVTDALRDQAKVIVGSHVIPNTKGTAAGMIIGCGERFNNHYLVLMPGVPSEMKAMMELTVLPYFEALSTSFIRHTPVKTLGIGETTLAEMIVEVEDRLPSGTTLAYLPHAAGVTLMISSIGPDREVVEGDNRSVTDAIVRRAGRFIYATGESTLEETIGEKLVGLGMTVAVAESCTGGLVASRFTDVPGSSAYFLQGYVVYSNQAKARTLGVEKELIEEFGAVSEEVARAMATGCLEKSGADFALATTGIAGPGGGSPEKPVGMLCLALAEKSSGTVHSRTLFMHGDRELNKLRFSEAVLRELWEYLRSL